MEEAKAEYREKVDKKLIIRQRIYVVAVIAIFLINVVNVYYARIAFVLALSGFLLSTAIGLLLSRMFKIFWHEGKGKVASKLDTIGTILLVFYILLELNRKWIFSHWLSGAELNSFVLIVLGGLLLGRFLGTRFLIKSVLEENK